MNRAHTIARLREERARPRVDVTAAVTARLRDEVSGGCYGPLDADCIHRPNEVQNWCHACLFKFALNAITGSPEALS